MLMSQIKLWIGLYLRFLLSFGFEDVFMSNFKRNYELDQKRDWLK